MRNARNAIANTLLELARQDISIFAICADSRDLVTLNQFADELSNQFVECGVAEQNAVGIGAGLANAGLKPFVCGPASFFSIRAAEQIKVDMAYSHMNVKVIGVSGGVSSGALGFTHHATHDVAFLRSIQNMTVILPADYAQTAAIIKLLVEHNGPVYVRVGHSDVVDIYKDGTAFEIGKAVWLKHGDDVSVIACGDMVARAIEAAELLEADGIKASVLDMHTLKPIDEAAVLKAASAGAVVTVEEHVVSGGLGSAAAEILCGNNSVKLRILGLPVEPLYNGEAADILSHYGLTAEGIANAAKEIII